MTQIEKEIAWLLKDKYKGEKTAGFLSDCTQLEAGTPLAYVIGYVPFLDCQIWLDSHPLIPRPETEYWVEKAIECIKTAIINKEKLISQGVNDQANHISKTSCKKDPEPIQVLTSNWGEMRILDLCAGSGTIGVAVAQRIPETLVTFAEIDPNHLPTIEKNLKNNLNQYPNQLEYFKIIQSDLFENISGYFDFILTNPPYIDQTANTVDQSVTDNEPYLALFGGKDGTEIINRIIIEAKKYLKPASETYPGGQIWIEHEPFQTKAIFAIATNYGFTTSTYPDQYGTLRYSVLTQTMA